MKCEVNNCKNESVMVTSVQNRYKGPKRLCQYHWTLIVKANKEKTELPFTFKEKVV